MLRHLLPFIPDADAARELRALLESDAPLVLCAADRPSAVRLLAIACAHRLPHERRVALRSQQPPAGPALEEFAEITIRDLGPELTATAGLRSAMRMDPDGIIVDDLADDDIPMFAACLQTGHVFGTIAIARHASAEAALSAWSGILGGAKAAGAMLAQAVFIELSGEGGAPLIRSVATIRAGRGLLRLQHRYRRLDFPFIPDRDRDLEARHRRSRGSDHPLHLADGTPRTAGRPVPEELATAADIAERPAAAGGSRALVPICTAVDAAAKAAINAAVAGPDWPRLADGRPAFVVAAFTPPPAARGPVAAGQRFLLCWDDRSEDGGDDGFRVVLAASDAPPAINLLREHYAIRSWAPCRDPRAGGDDGMDDGPYAGNKLLGRPAWLQGDATPVCTQCGKPMSLYLQLDGEGGELANLWGDARLYVFHCQLHPGAWRTLRQWS